MRGFLAFGCAVDIVECRVWLARPFVSARYAPAACLVRALSESSQKILRRGPPLVGSGSRGFTVDRARKRRSSPPVELARPTADSHISTSRSLTMFYSCVRPSFGDETALKLRPSLVDSYTLPAWPRTPPLSHSSSTTSVAEPEPEPGVDEPSTFSSFDFSSSSASLDYSDASIFSEARAESPLSTPLKSFKPELVSTARRIHRLLVGLPCSLSFSGPTRRRDVSLNFKQASKVGAPRNSRTVNFLLLRYLFLIAHESPYPDVETSVEAPELNLASPYLADSIFLELLPEVLLSMLLVAQRASPLEHLFTRLCLEVAREKKDRRQDSTTGLVHLTSLPLPAILLTFYQRSSSILSRWFVLEATIHGAMGIYLISTQQYGILNVALAVSVPDPSRPETLELLTVYVGYFDNGDDDETFYREELENHSHLAPPVTQVVQDDTSLACHESVGEFDSPVAPESHEAHAKAQLGGQGPLEPEEYRTRRRVQRGDVPMITINGDARKLVNEAGITKNDGRRPNKLRKPRRPIYRVMSPRPTSRAASPMPLSPKPLSPRSSSPMTLSPRPLSPRPSSSRPLSPRPISPRPVSPVAPQLATYKVIRLNIQFAPLRFPNDDTPRASPSKMPAHATPQRRGLAKAEAREERKVLMAGFKAAGCKWKGKLKGRGRGMAMSRFARMSAETKVREAAVRSQPTSPVAGASRTSVGSISHRLGEPVVNTTDNTPVKKQKMKWGKYVRKLSSG